jgi:hypothetical protein
MKPEVSPAPPADFPFPITTGAVEPKSLTWIRNHSNYMAAGGLFDYLRAVGVLLRGVLGNFLVFVPYLLIIALAVAAANFFGKPAPFLLTKILLALFIGWVVLFVVLPPVYRIIRYRTSTLTGSDSSVKERNIYELSFGGLLLAIVAVAGLESLPFMLDSFHVAVFESDVGWPSITSAIVAATTAFSLVPRMLAILGKGVTRRIAVFAIGMLGLLLPLLFVLFVADFIVFSSPRDWTEPLEWAGWLFPVGIIVTVGIGWLLRAFRREDAVPIGGLIIGAIVLLGLGKYVDDRVLECCLGTENAAHLDAALVELKQHPAELQALIKDVVGHPGPELAQIDQWLENFEAHVELKRDFFRRPLEIEIEDGRYEGTDAYREYRADKIAFYDLDAAANPSSEALLTELLQELFAELRNEAHDIEGLASIPALVDSIESSSVQRTDEQTLDLIEKLYGLNQQVAFLRDLFSNPAPVDVAAKLSTVRPPQRNMDTVSPYEEEFASAQQSLTIWVAALDEARAEIEDTMPYSPSDAFVGKIGELANRPDSRFRALLARWEAHRSLRDRRRDLIQQPGGSPSLDELLAELASVGYADPDLYGLVAFSRAIRKEAAANREQPDVLNELIGETHDLYRRSALLRNLLSGESLEELTAKVVALRKGDLDLVEGVAEEIYAEPSRLTRWLSAAWTRFGYEYDREVVGWEFPGYRHLSILPGFSDIDTILFDGAQHAFLLRDEIVATAILSPQNAALFATPIAMRVRENYFWPKFAFVGMLAIQLWILCWLAVDVNLTSIHGLYRDRLASAFLFGEGRNGGIRIEKDLNLNEICNYEAGSIAPYHLINVALNLQGSKAVGLRDRQSDFFMFSKRFIGGKLTGYCRSEHMERVFPQMDLATAMAISAAAASPNMGRATSPGLVAFMTLLNVRLGYWVPNPGRLESWLKQKSGEATAENGSAGGFTFEDVFEGELIEIEARWAQLEARRAEPGREVSKRRLVRHHVNPEKLLCTSEYRLVGLGYSGGGIRSATLNLGITQALHQRGVFDHVDYMSTVSGGGYLGSSISTLMRGPRPAGTTDLRHSPEPRKQTQDSVSKLFHWRVRPAALVREIFSKLNEESRLVNVSDGGHIENLAGIELLRRRCKYIIIGDGEADPDHHFSGLATLIRSARIDLGIDIDINVDALRLAKKGSRKGLCLSHWAVGLIKYPDTESGEAVPPGYLLYLKSSVTGDEDEVIQQYRNSSASFPHESTADQFFCEGQFEAYRSLGQHIAEKMFEESNAPGTSNSKMSFTSFEKWLPELWQNRSSRSRESEADTKA